MAEWVHIITAISAFSLFSLGVVCLVSGRRELVWRLLAVFSFLLMLTSLLVVGARVSNDPGIIRFCLQMAFLSSILSVLFAVYYTDVLTDSYRRVRLFKWSMSLKIYVVLAAILALILLGALLMSRLIISSTEIDPSGYPKVTYGPLSYIVYVLIVAGIVKISSTFRKAYRHSADRNYREFIRFNNLAFHLLYIPAILLDFLGPRLGLPEEVTNLVVFLALPVAVIFFYIAILRYQFARVRELTVDLEKKVEERTAALKEAQARLSQQDKMASLGLLVASVSHEINNPIGAIRSIHSSLMLTVKKLREAFDEPDRRIDEEKLQKIMNVIESANRVIDDGTRRVSEFIRRLRSFVSLDQAELQTVDVRDGINDAVMLIRPKIKSDIKITKIFKQIPRVLCNPRQLNQVFLNILINAVQAIDGPGEIIITTYTENERLHIGFSDTGMGIPEENLEKIFNPGFTTKDEVTGIGLGLSISSQIVRSHNGELKVASEPGRGSTFTVILPQNFRTEPTLVKLAV